MAQNQEGKGGGFASNPKLASEAGRKGGQAKSGKGGNQKGTQKS